jgi:hypothetical protein
VLAGGSLVGTDLPANGVYMGVPAVSKAQAYEQIMAMKRLPRVMAQLREMRAKLGL